MHRMAAYAFRKGIVDEEWKKLIRLAGESSPSIHTLEMMRGFFGKRIIKKKEAGAWNDSAAPTVLCVEKDSLTYLRHFLPYYRGLGIGHFVFIDNASSDGTVPYLMEQKDVTLYSAPFPFEHRRKAGWLLQALQETGTDRWYLRLDADEFLAWQGMEKSSLQELIARMEKNGMGTFRAVMTDMYPDYSLMDRTHADDCFMEDYLYFDDSSSYHLNAEKDELYGGMRYRVSGIELRMDKYVIFHPGRGYIPLTNHGMAGVRNTAEKKFRGVLLHYKFLPSEAEKYLRIATDKASGYSSFKEINKYQSLVDRKTSVLSDCSIRYDSSENIQEFDIITPLQFP